MKIGFTKSFCSCFTHLHGTEWNWCKNNHQPVWLTVSLTVWLSAGSDWLKSNSTSQPFSQFALCDVSLHQVSLRQEGLWLPETSTEALRVKCLQTKKNRFDLYSCVKLSEKNVKLILTTRGSRAPAQVLSCVHNWGTKSCDSLRIIFSFCAKPSDFSQERKKNKDFSFHWSFLSCVKLTDLNFSHVRKKNSQKNVILQVKRCFFCPSEISFHSVSQMKRRIFPEEKFFDSVLHNVFVSRRENEINLVSQKNP